MPHGFSVALRDRATEQRDDGVDAIIGLSQEMYGNISRMTHHRFFWTVMAVLENPEGATTRSAWARQFDAYDRAELPVLDITAQLPPAGAVIAVLEQIRNSE